MDGLDGDLAPDDSSNEWLFTKFYNCKLIYSAGELLTQVSRNCYALATYEHYFQTFNKELIDYSSFVPWCHWSHFLSDNLQEFCPLCHVAIHVFSLSFILKMISNLAFYYKKLYLFSKMPNSNHYRLTSK